MNLKKERIIKMEITLNTRGRKRKIVIEENYFFCCKSSVPSLVRQAEYEAARLVKEFNQYYTTSEPVSIEIRPVEHPLYYSIGALLKFGDKVMRSEETCDLVFLEINKLIQKKIGLIKE